MKNYCHATEKEQREESDRLKCTREEVIKYGQKLVIVAQMYSPKLDRYYTSVPGFRIGFKLLKSNNKIKEISLVEPIKKEDRKALEELIVDADFKGAINYW